MVTFVFIDFYRFNHLELKYSSAAVWAYFTVVKQNCLPQKVPSSGVKFLRWK
ncbi:hypothetical protein ANANG_G00045690, partial [Anguilla anguilla]